MYSKMMQILELKNDMPWNCNECKETAVIYEYTYIYMSTYAYM